jgi:hypothetical protein
VTVARDAIANGQVEEVHAEIRSIHGVGPKIAAFFMRDVAIQYEIEPDRNRDLLQLQSRSQARADQSRHAGGGNSHPQWQQRKRLTVRFHRSMPFGRLPNLEMTKPVGTLVVTNGIGERRRCGRAEGRRALYPRVGLLTGLWLANRHRDFTGAFAAPARQD